MLKRVKDKVPKGMLDIVYKTIIQPHIDYCINVWGDAPDVHIDKIQCIQCRAADLVSGVVDWNVRGIDLVRRFRVPNCKGALVFFTAVLMYNQVS